MAKTMTQSKITDGQIDKAADVFRAALRKHRAEFVSDVAQQIVLNPALGHELLAVFRQLAEAAGGIIVRNIKVNRDRTPKEALDAMGRKQYVNREVAETMPRGEGDEDDVHFFQVGRYRHHTMKLHLEATKTDEPRSFGAWNNLSRTWGYGKNYSREKQADRCFCCLMECNFIV